MARYLKLEELRSEGPIEVGQLQSGDVIVGREPDNNGVALSSRAVSRNHGVFTKVRNHWMYRDLGSTNGSWINGVQCKPNQWRLVRAGNVMQFADLLVRIGSGGDAMNRNQPAPGISSIGGRSLLVFSAEDFVDEFLIPEYGRALVIGGSQADLALEGDIFEQASLVIERRGDKICAFSLVKEVEWLLNDEVRRTTSDISDGDIIQLGNYTVLLNDPSHGSADFTPQKVGGAREWGASDAPSSGRMHTKALGGFGQAPLESQAGVDETMALDPSEMESKMTGADMHPSMRYNIGTFGGGSGAGGLEDRLILAIGLILFFVVAGLALWWMIG
ncbi:MAG: FHA domain-containing protein [Oligoflexia bacterium]|nr:FHA domain-containing protein [Oligoflexia bacterium]